MKEKLVGLFLILMMFLLIGLIIYHADFVYELIIGIIIIFTLIRFLVMIKFFGKTNNEDNS